MCNLKFEEGEDGTHCDLDPERGLKVRMKVLMKLICRYAITLMDVERYVNMGKMEMVESHNEHQPTFLPTLCV